MSPALRTQLHTRHFRRQWCRSYAAAAAPRTDVYDVICIGGGPAGLSLLTALRANPNTAHLRVALIEARNLANTRLWNLPPGQFSNRCSSLTPSSISFLDKIGAWKCLARDRIQAYDAMQVWDGVTGARIHFDWPAGRSTAGKTIAYMTENVNLTSGLLKRLEELGGVSMFDNTKVERITPGERSEGLDLRQWPVVHLSGGQQLYARLLVGADGAKSLVRAFAGIEARGWDYDQHGVVATINMSGEGWAGEESKIAYQRFLPTGPVAMLPMPGHRATLVWSTTPKNASFLKRLSAEDFVAMVNAAFRLSPTDLAYLHTQTAGLADEIAWRSEHSHYESQAIPQTVVGVQHDSVGSFPLKFQHADTYISDRVALVGDAAHTIHPLAGQGLNQGQGDIQSLARTIEYAVNHGQDIGSRMALEPYVGERYLENHVILGVCDKLHKLYSVGSGPLVSLRSWGLSAVNVLGPLKTFLMTQAAANGIKVLNNHTQGPR